MDKSESGEGVKSTVSLSRKMSKVGLLAAMKTFTKPHFQRKKKTKEKAVSRSWDSGLCNVGLTPSPSGGQGGLGTVGSYKRIYWPGQEGCVCQGWVVGGWLRGSQGVDDDHDDVHRGWCGQILIWSGLDAWPGLI